MRFRVCFEAPEAIEAVLLMVTSLFELQWGDLARELRPFRGLSWSLSAPELACAFSSSHFNFFRLHFFLLNFLFLLRPHSSCRKCRSRWRSRELLQKEFNDCTPARNLGLSSPYRRSRNGVMEEALQYHEVM